MSKILDLGENYKNLPDLIAEYQQHLTAASDRLRIKGKMLDVAHQEQCSWPVFYDVKKAEIKSLVKYFTAEVARVRGHHLRRYTENYSRALGDRAINGYIDAEPTYNNVYQLLIEIEELYDQYSAVCDAFNKRGFALRDLTTAMVNQLHQLPI